MTTAPLTSATSARLALYENLIDYAGLFPPAKEDMETAVANYARYVEGDDAWMIERFVVPVGRLEEFERAAAGKLPSGDGEEPWPLSVLTAAAGDEQLAKDVEAIMAFNERHCDPADGLAVCDVIELKGDDPEGIDVVLDDLPEELFPFFEIDWRNDPRGLIAALVGGDAGAKIRTGGLEPAAFPTIEALAAFIEACATSDVPFKATAGLHHPLRHHADAVGCEMHGFLNVFIASLMAIHHDVEAEGLEPMLAATDSGAFTVNDDAVGFGELVCDRDEVEDARLSFSISFGSCSFDEPREDLRGLGLL